MGRKEEEKQIKNKYWYLAVYLAKNINYLGNITI